ncbi:MAG: hypothetical protein JNK78_10185 [Planctomycetes bacterium]|nr:hypothetical protein [Planctomycetota bacterium]
MTAAAAAAPAPLPRWFLLLPLVVAAAWWPLAPYWKSDDFLMLHHANDAARVLGDFVGPQYGATDVWYFWRPLMTASFWLELQLGGGPSPMLSHTTNVLVHAGSALLVALLWRRWIGGARGFVAGLVWGLMPGHEGAITWAVGRSDVHGTFWSLLAMLWFCRRLEGRAPWWPSLLATTCALMTKEIAFVLPAAATLLAYCRDPGRGAGTALRAAAPIWAVFAVCFGWRFLALGRLGGYGDMPLAPLPMLLGFGHVVADLLVPLRYAGATASHWAWLGAAPVALVMLWHFARGGPRRLAASTAMFVAACAPMAPFFAAFANTHNLRYYCLPTAALAGLFALPHRWSAAALLLLAAWTAPFVALRSAVHDADAKARAMHGALLQLARTTPTEPIFVAGLPTSEGAAAVVFHFGVDRMLAPPFTERTHRLLPLRPVVAGGFSLGEDRADFEALPAGSTWQFARPDLLAQRTAVSPLPDLPIAGDDRGVVDVTSGRLAAMEKDERGLCLDTGVARTQACRLTIFTALGYLACLFPDHGKEGERHGAIDMLQFFAGERALGLPPETARPTFASFAPGAFATFALGIPTTHDLVPEFPALVEVGSMQGDTFVPSHRARRLLTLRFDRGYQAWVRRAFNLGG